MSTIIKSLKEAGYDYGIAIATQAEIEVGAACGQLSLLEEQWVTKAGDTVLNIDFGSGYHPYSNYKTCDMVYSPQLDYFYDKSNNIIYNLEFGTVDQFRLKNVLHHVDDIFELCTMLNKYLKTKGSIKVIEPRAEFYTKNTILDIIWYRYVQKFYHIKIYPNYRDYISCIERAGFQLISKECLEVYDISLFQKM